MIEQAVAVGVDGSTVLLGGADVRLAVEVGGSAVLVGGNIVAVRVGVEVTNAVNVGVGVIVEVVGVPVAHVG